ncbi:hypothetical protein M5C97_03610 [Acidovorax sp. NCPPB 3859]|uniref:hypothetical protein n=1 Tax=Paracidovorax avenae TaxID=80867 RepID=UPI0005A2083D|nr:MULTISPECIES: hypothetical protein [Comamonadaceae]AVS64734.1 hypothetical protein C8245_02625 [Paracidovorax avenae]MDA8450095.1 hypothetical protein [Acidovorax sp. GBBC 3297]MDA8459560.1 hypothetical protein [Acidovorax sp. GBBC 3333]MDA8464576.1 hypothetical protein [Acidovorax sp. GBBC 3332]MDA8469630.1 hypothetical protein [Acidovorax sp. GBBC 3299]
MSLVIAELIFAFYLLIAGEVFYYLIEGDLRHAVAKILLRILLVFGAPLIVGYIVFGATVSMAVLMFSYLAGVFICGIYLKPIIIERQHQILLDLPYFDMEKYPFLSAGSLVIAYWVMAALFIKEIIE